MKIKLKKSNENFKIQYLALEVEAKSSKIIADKSENLNRLVKACRSMKNLGIDCDEVFYDKKSVSASFVLKSAENFSKKVNTIKKTLQTVIDTLE